MANECPPKIFLLASTILISSLPELQELLIWLLNFSQKELVNVLLSWCILCGKEGLGTLFLASSRLILKWPFLWASIVAQVRIYLQCGIPGFNPWAGKIPWRREWLGHFYNWYLKLSSFQRLSNHSLLNQNVKILETHHYWNSLYYTL